MSEWWTYRLADFLMFSPRTYTRLFELYNRDVWPLHIVAFAIGVAILILARRERPRVIAVLLAIAWLWVAWAFHLQRYATIHTFAQWFAAAFALEAILLLFFFRSAVAKPPLWIFALILFLYPFLSNRHELFAIAPDPTALATIALVAGDKKRWLLLPIPLLWCVVSGATLLAMAAR